MASWLTDVFGTARGSYESATAPLRPSHGSMFDPASYGPYKDAGAVAQAIKQYGDSRQRGYKTAPSPPPPAGTHTSWYVWAAVAAAVYMLFLRK